MNKIKLPDYSFSTDSSAGSGGTFTLTDSIDLSSMSLSSNGMSSQDWANLGAVGSSNIVYTTTTGTGTGGVGWNLNTTIAPAELSQAGKMSLNGSNADVEINGKSMKAWMEKVEERLNILTPNPELEKEWDDLRRLGERYRKLEKKCKEKAEVWKKLKEMPPPNLD